MGENITAEVSLKCEDPKKAYDSLKPEIENTDRFSVKVIPESNSLKLKVEAKDIGAMKAALNSYLRLMSLIKEVEK